MGDMVDDLFSVFNGTDDAENGTGAKKGRLHSRVPRAGSTLLRSTGTIPKVENKADDTLINSSCTNSVKTISCSAGTTFNGESGPLSSAGSLTKEQASDAIENFNNIPVDAPPLPSADLPSADFSSAGLPSADLSSVDAHPEVEQTSAVALQREEEKKKNKEEEAITNEESSTADSLQKKKRRYQCEEHISSRDETQDSNKAGNPAIVERLLLPPVPVAKRARVDADVEDVREGKLEKVLLLAEEQDGRESKSSGMIVETLASDDNCLHEVVRPANCALRFVYYPFETTELKVPPSSSSSAVAAEEISAEIPSSSSSSSLISETKEKEENTVVITSCAATDTPSSHTETTTERQNRSSSEGTTLTTTTTTEKQEEASKQQEGSFLLSSNDITTETSLSSDINSSLILSIPHTQKKDEKEQQQQEEEKQEKKEEEKHIVERFGPRPDHLPAAPARVYKFKLDTFQQRSVLALEAGENVLVAAHTSAGKTVVAEYAIAMSLRDKQRVVYTSPIKALSNQKYRDFCELFGSESVGLLTGDVTLQPHASILVMTTEILRSMLYRGSPLLHAIKWVVFDEIHYMRDRERGVVWEESIVLLPRSVNLVFLSATIPNAREFAAWITHLKQQPCHLFFTDYRPTPLQHYLFPAGGDGVYLVVDEKKKFREENFHKALAILNSSVEEQAMQINQHKKQRRARAARTISNVKKIVLMCHARNYTPVIIFCFSKRECEANATMLLPPASSSIEKSSGLKKDKERGSHAGDAIDLTTSEEKQLIEEVFNNALETLEEDDRQLPQVKSILPLLKRGIGIHHGGLLPFIKEIIEILFQESLVRVLFSTETFSMGVNMPAKTVVFTAIRKWDGQEYRIINSGEYIQMAGRAGRRGLDDRGIVIIMLDEQVDPEEAKHLFLGQASPLLSTFHLGFNMLLNLFRIEDADPLFMITRSFAYFQRNRRAMQLEQQKEELEEAVTRAADIRMLLNSNVEEEKEEEKEQKANLNFDVEANICKYYELKHDLATLGKDVQKICMQQQHIIKYLQAGRILRIVEEDGVDWGWSPCVTKVRRQLIASTNAYEGPAEILLVECLMCCSPASAAAAGAGAAGGGDMKTSSSLSGDEKALPHLQRHKFKPAVFSRQTSSIEKEEIYKEKQKKSQATSNQTKTAEDNYILEILSFPISSIRSISKCRMVLPLNVDLHAHDAQKSLYFQFHKILQKFQADGGLPVLDPIQDMKIQDPRLHELVRLLADKEIELMNNPFYEHPLCQKYYDAYHQRMQLKNRLREVRDALDGQKQLVMKEQLRSMRRVLRKLEFLDSQDIVTMKGRVACEITTADELVAAELLFQNVFENMDVEVICAVLSCLVFEEKHEELEPAEETLLTGLEKVRDVARHIASVYVESRYIDSASQQQHIETGTAGTSGGETANKAVDDYVNKFQHAMMMLTYRWAKGESFAAVIADTNLYEGTVIRCMRRLEELMRQMACASKTVGNVDLERKFLDGIKKIRRAQEKRLDKQGGVPGAVAQMMRTSRPRSVYTPQ